MAEAYTKSWHFPRTDLARGYLKALVDGAASLALFAERRKGKTEFLRDDLKPLAIKEGIQVCYINFWRDRVSPENCVLAGVKKTLEESLKTGLSGLQKELSLNLGVVSAKLSSQQQPQLSDAITALDEVIKHSDRTLFMFDEIQHLATSDRFLPFTASLRTFLESEKGSVRAVFTGSSRDNLDRLFRLHKAPFFNAASLVPFPDLDAAFTTFLVKRFEYLSRRSLDADVLLSIFVSQGFSPAYVVELLQFMNNSGVYELGEGKRRYDELNPPDLGAKQSWESLNALDKELMARFELSPEKSLYTPETYTELATKLGTKVTKSAIQNGIERLRDKGLIWREGRGIWRIENQQLSAIVRDEYEPSLLNGERF